MQYGWNTEDLQDLDTIIQDMKRDYPGWEVNADKLTSYIHQCYPDWYGRLDYPYGVFADGFDQWQAWKRQQAQPC